MSQRSLVIIGHGRMGKAVEQLAAGGGWHVLAALDAGWRQSAERDVLAQADVAIEFSEPRSAPDNIRAAVGAGCPVVCGTTGWYEHLDDISAYVKSSNGALLWSPNFAVGAQIMFSLGGVVGGLMKSAGTFEGHIVETHHMMKKDKPSGTAAALAAAVESEYGRQIPITSIRLGHVPGTHELIFDSAFEQIRIIHVARDRRVFAAGALLAAGWLAERKGVAGGVFTMRDMLGQTTADGERQNGR
jgi:4-hydroxy-tetrahydrodipicolinate reductase